jgi:hypothetical protein
MMSEIRSLDEAMSAAAESAVGFARDCGVTLDYSESSIEKVEHLIGELHKSMATERPPEKQVDRMCTMFGAYIADVIRRRWGGQWGLDSKLQPGEKVLTFTVSTIDMWPQSKVYKRLTNGPEDDLRWYFQGFKDQIKDKE